MVCFRSVMRACRRRWLVTLRIVVESLLSCERNLQVLGENWIGSWSFGGFKVLVRRFFVRAWHIASFLIGGMFVGSLEKIAS